MKPRRRCAADRPNAGRFYEAYGLQPGRWAETPRVKWLDVDFERRQLTIGTDGLSKNREARAVDFNAHLAAQLQDMHRRRAPDSQFLFPSTKRDEGAPTMVTLNKASTKVREMAGIPDFTCHLCRYFFFSFCVMAGIDYMTIARWVAHKDGGVLIGKVYGHLTNEHAQRQAQKLVFGPTVVARYCSPFLETALAFAQLCLSSTAETKARFLGVHFNGRIFFVGSNLSTRRQWLC